MKHQRGLDYKYPCELQAFIKYNHAYGLLEIEEVETEEILFPDSFVIAK